MLSVRGLPNLIAVFFSKTRTEQMKQVTTLDVNMSFSHGLPVFDRGTHFVMGEVHDMEMS